MRNRKLVIGLIVFLLLALGTVWLMGALRPPTPQFEPLTLERKLVGQLPPPPVSAGKDIYYNYLRAMLVDFDGNGSPEVLALGEVLVGSYLQPAYTAWLSLQNGATSRTPLLALQPSVLAADGDFTLDAPIAPNSLPLLREVIAWDSRAQEPLLLRRTEKGWQTEPLAALKGERLQNALAIDFDQDGLLNDYLLQTQSGKLATLKPDAAGRIQLQRLLLATPVEIEALLRDARVHTYPPTSGVAPLPHTFGAKRLKLPDMDGDSKPEWIVAGDGVKRKVAQLHLSRNGIRVSMPFERFSLSRQAEAAELDGAPPPELVVISKGASNVQVQVYQMEKNKLKVLDALQEPIGYEWLPYWLHDLDGDGRTELILADRTADRSSILHWRVFRYQNGAFQQIASHFQKMPHRLGHLYQPKRIRSGLLFVADMEPTLAWLTGAGGDVTVLATFPKGDAALNPANWRFTLLPDVNPAWYGDYDGDGVEEVVLSGRFSESYLLQIREDALHGAKLSKAAIATVLPAPVDGAPYLVFVHERGAVEQVRVLKP